MRSRYLRYVLWAAAVIGALMLSGCERKTINEIKANPSLYANKEVAVVGEVTRSVSVLGKGAYEVDDGTGRLCVASKTGVPRKGAKIAVKGTIRDAYDLSSFGLPDPICSGMVMIESSHKAR
jgi:hypothetical protein